MNINFLLDNIKRFNKNSRELCNGNRKLPFFWLSEIYCAVRFGCSPDDYFRYEFYKKSNLERDKFITYRRSQKFIHKYNNPQYIKILEDKTEFNKFFSEFINREWLDLRTASKQDFTEFAKRHKKIIMKPLCGGRGIGIFKLNSEECDDFVLDDYRNYIAEEFLHQHDKMNQLNPSSVNTVRVLTFKGEIVACTLRIGSSNAIIDNLHSNGICARLDIDSGIIDTLCLDNKMNKYLFHPFTGMKLVGFEVPNYSLIKTQVEKAAKMIPQLQYIGWDVAVLNDGIALIEGNHDPGHGSVQQISQTGLYYTIKNKE